MYKIILFIIIIAGASCKKAKNEIEFGVQYVKYAYQNGNNQKIEYLNVENWVFKNDTVFINAMPTGCQFSNNGNSVQLGCCLFNVTYFENGFFFGNETISAFEKGWYFKKNK